MSGAYLVRSFPESNAGFLLLVPVQNSECLFEGLIAIFEHLGCEAVFCNRGKSSGKGNIENKVRYLRRSLQVPESRFESLDRRNTQLLEECRTDMNRPQYLEEQWIAELFRADQASLMPLPRIPFDPASYHTLTADGYGMIVLDGGIRLSVRGSI